MVTHRQRALVPRHLQYPVLEYDVAVDRAHPPAVDVEPQFAVERALAQPPGIDIEQVRDRPGLQIRRVDVKQAVVGRQHRLDQDAAAELRRQRGADLHEVLVAAMIDVGPDPLEGVLGAAPPVANDEAAQIDLEVARRQREALGQVANRSAVAVGGERELVEPPATVGIARQLELLESAADLARDRGPGAQAGPEIELDHEPVDEHRLRAVRQRQRQVFDPQHGVEAVHVAVEAAEGDSRIDVLGQQVFDFRLEIVDIDHRQAQRPQRQREQNDRGGQQPEGNSFERLHNVCGSRLHRHHVVGFLRKVGFHL